MYEFRAHARQLADLENSVHDARQRNTALPGHLTRIISVMAAILVAGALIGAGAV